MHGDVDDGAPEDRALGHHEGQHGEGGGHRGGEAEDPRQGEHGVGSPAEQKHPHQHQHLHTAQGAVDIRTFHETAPTGRTWLWLHQAGGASNISEGFAI